jgi:hypothetical protein
MVRLPVTKATAALVLTLTLVLAAVPSQAAGFSFSPERLGSWEQLATSLLGWLFKSAPLSLDYCAGIDPDGRCGAAAADQRTTSPGQTTALCLDDSGCIDPNG